MDHFSFYLLTFLSLILFTSSQNPTVKSTFGDIVGNTTTVRLNGLPERNINEYLGIPFAQPPVGELRFRKPERMTSVPSPFYAQNHGAICPQLVYTAETMNVQQSEDCLFLNVYVPERSDTRPADSPNGYAVMVWIHGGGFRAGASNFYNGSSLAALGNIIVVTINYRVGVLGFLSTGDDKDPSNFGLWDQHMALQWVHDYIGDFGGDNQRVTVAGGSAGGMSTMYHAMTTKNHGLFQRIITQSGSVSNPTLGLDRDGLKDTATLADSLKCKTDSMKEAINCLREKSTDELLTALQNTGMYVSYGPLVDGDLIEINPLHIAKMSEGQYLEQVDFFRSLDILSGFNAFEGAFTLPFAINPGQIENFQPTREDMRTNYLPIVMNVLFSMNFAEEVMKLVEAQYTNWTNPDDYNSVRLQITKLSGDRTFGVPAIEMARLHKKSSASRNFMYHFAPKPSAGGISAPSWIPGATHADEVFFMFGAIGKIGVGIENAWEKDLAMKMMTYWTNFVKSGDPNSPEPVSPYWPEYSTDTGDYIVLDKSMSKESAKQQFYAKEANFWLELFPGVVDAVQGDGKECGDGTFTSSAAGIPLYRTLSFAIVMVLCFTSVF